MGKICDPPPFTGGQSAGIRYKIHIKSRYWASPAGLLAYAYTYQGFKPVANEQYKEVTESVDLFNDGTQILGAILGLTVSSTNVNILKTSQYPNGKPIHSLGFQGQSAQFFITNPSSKNEILGWYITRFDGQTDTGGDPPSTNCRCSDDSCRVDCADGFCCIDHAVTDRLLQIIKT